MYHMASITCPKCHLGNLKVELNTDDQAGTNKNTYEICPICKEGPINDMEKTAYLTLMYQVKFNSPRRADLEELMYNVQCKQALEELDIKCSYIDIYDLITNDDRLRKVRSKLKLKVFW